MPTRLTLNGKPVSHTGDPDMPLLWVTRDDLALLDRDPTKGVGALDAIADVVRAGYDYWRGQA